ncbi:hypothetical protein HN51_058432, partial [Arachis hypogaea]
KQGIRLYTPRKHFSLYPRLEKIFCKDRANEVAVVCGNDAEEEVQQDGDEEVDAVDMDMFNSNHDFSESLLQQSNSVASSSEKKQGKKPYSSKGAKDTKMMKELTDTLKDKLGSILHSKSTSFLISVVTTLLILPGIALSMKFIFISGRRFFNMRQLLLCSEIFPTRVCGLCIAICAPVLWIGSIIVTYTLPMMLNSIELTGFFGIYAVACSNSWIFVFLKVPETKGMLLPRTSDKILISFS